MSKIYLLSGLIASGKSTYAKNAAKQGYIIINDDSIVNAVHGDDYTLYDKSLKLIYKSVEHTILSTSLALKRSVIIDRGLNLSLNGRKRWIALANSFDVPIEAIEFPMETPEIHAQRRMQADSRGHDINYWLSVANYHYDKRHKPFPVEGFSKVHQISFQEITEGKVIT